MSTPREVQPEDKGNPDEARKEEQQAHPIAKPDPVRAEGQAQAGQQQSTLLQIRAQLFAESFSGPLPHPDIRAKFEQVVPGAAARIMKMAETQSHHRQSLERTVIEGDIRRSWAGLWTGFIIGMTGVIGSIVLGLFDHPGIAGVLGGATLISLVSVFVLGTKSRQEERSQKAKVMTGGNAASETLTQTSAGQAPS